MQRTARIRFLGPITRKKTRDNRDHIGGPARGVDVGDRRAHRTAGPGLPHRSREQLRAHGVSDVERAHDVGAGRGLHLARLLVAHERGGHVLFHAENGLHVAHAGRDPIFWATLAVAEQDFDGDETTAWTNEVDTLLSNIDRKRHDSQRSVIGNIGR